MLTTLRVVTTLVLALAVTPAIAQSKGGGGFDPNQIFFGAGLSINDVPGSDEGIGYQFFGGYEFGELAPNFKLDLEVGYMNTGDMDVKHCVNVAGMSACAGGSVEAKGLWSTAVARLALNREWELIGRAGLDFGDDDGLMVGAGIGFMFEPRSTLRFELVERDSVSSIQFNYVYRP